VLEATLAAMGPGPVTAIVGPCIGPASYEVAADLRDAILARDPADARFFTDGRPGHWLFDLPGYCAARLTAAGATATVLGADTLPDETRFFSHRRRTLAGGGPIGHQISIVSCPFPLS
jgi:copper oxidase (laccase) domain-containing protein